MHSFFTKTEQIRPFSYPGTVAIMKEKTKGDIFMNHDLTRKVKDFAYSLGADLVGIANVERWENAPIAMSPLGILPTAKSVIVCAIHHPDAAIELDGEIHPQVIGPYRVQYTMNIWRYRGYKDLDADFSPDISHIYSGVCAGLGELGWNGLCITPEYGARNRFVSIITDAELEPTPLLPGGTLCDMCGECIRCCPTDAYRKEVKGVNALNIRDADGKVYVHRFANKNLWRCAWGEHFDLDLDDEIPDVVTEEAISV